ncbi:hypothetical protein NFI96_014406 [Prochilodus magdalenae]|nr:hypothetical protein NFI96_014406 [Prochilodus magdalenae]
MGIKSFIILYCCVVWVLGHEFHSSTDRMATLQVLEQNLLKSFSHFIEEEAAYLEQLRDVQLDLEIRFYFERTETELSDPVAAYRLMWRLRDAWDIIFESTKLSPIWGYQEQLKKESHQFPDQEDIDGAANRIIQLKQIYNLYPQDIWITTYPETDRMATLKVMEQNLVDNFIDFITEEAAYLEKLRSVQHDLEIRKNIERTEPELSDPVAAYRLMWRLRDAWETIFESIKLSPIWGYQEQLKKESHHLPDQVDIDGVAHGIIQLQRICNLYPQDIWITKVPETGRVDLNLDEIFHLGRMAYELKNFQHAFLWFNRSFIHNLECENKRRFTKSELFEYLGSSAYEFGSLLHAIHYTKELLNLDPTNLEARHRLDYYESKRASHISYPDILTLEKTSSRTYEALCRGEAKSRRKRQLTCRYSTVGGNPRLMYTPVKEEEEWDEPQIMRYHNVVSDTEIELLKNLSRPLVWEFPSSKPSPELKRSKVIYDEGLGESYDRVSQSTWINEEHDPVVSRITQRLSDITGMDMESAEIMKVLNYGISGYFEPHYDALMSDVSIGGATVFPKIGASLKPQKLVSYGCMREDRNSGDHALCLRQNEDSAYSSATVNI